MSLEHRIVLKKTLKGVRYLVLLMKCPNKTGTGIVKFFVPITP